MKYKSREALDQFLDIIKNADQTFLNPEKVNNRQGHVDGYHHIFNLLKTSVEFYLLNDPLHPSFKLLADDQHKLYGDNVDSVYYFTQLRGDQEYLIKGKRFESCYLSFTVYGGEPTGELADHVSLSINHRDIVFEEDGSFEILLTSNPKGTNQYLLKEDAINLFTREYFFDRANQKESELSIENTHVIEKVKPLTDEEVAKRIQMMSTFFEQTTWVAPLPVEFPVNDFLPPFLFEADQGGWGTVDNVYCFGRFILEENQYLKIRFTSPNCCYWGIQTWNFLMQSMDYKNHTVCINREQAKANADGSFTIYLSHKKMDVDNCIETAGYKEAILFCRWLLADELPEQPTVELLEF